MWATAAVCLCRIAKTKQAAAAGAAVTKGVATGMQVGCLGEGEGGEGGYM
jgi:hypothetical protein